MKKSLGCIAKVIVAGVLALIVIEGVCRLYCLDDDRLYTYEAFEGVTDTVGKPYAKYRSLMEGRYVGTLNNEGYNNREDYHEGDAIDVLFMGSSHFRGSGISEDETVSAVFNDMQELRSYSIARSAHGFATNAQNLRAAVAKYQPDEYVVIEYAAGSLTDGELRLSLDGRYEKIDPSLDIKNDNVPFYTFYCRIRSMTKRLGKYADRLLGLFRSEAAEADAPEVPQETEDTPVTLETAELLFAQMRETAAESGARIVLVYHPATILSDSGELLLDSVPEEQEILRSACADNDMIFLDLGEIFLREYRLDHTLPHGFQNSKVGDGHLNAAGNRMLAEALADIAEGGRC